MPAAATAGHDAEVFDGQNNTISGSNDNDVNDWQVKPTGRSDTHAVTTTTPLAKRDTTSRKLVSSRGR